MIVLQSSYSGFSNTTAILHVSQMPPNPSIFAPGPAYVFVVVKGIPSIGVQVMIGSGNIEAQKILPIGSLPEPTIYHADDTTSSGSTTTTTTTDQKQKTSGAAFEYKLRWDRASTWLPIWTGVMSCLSLVY